MNNVIKPSDLIPDGDDSALINGVNVRKGSIGATAANIAVLEDPQASQADKDAAMAIIKDLVPSLKALGMHECMVWKNPEVQALYE